MDTTDRPFRASSSMQQFLNECRERGAPGERFEKESARLLRIDVDGGVWLKPGAAVAYRGDISFARRATLSASSLKDAAMREVTPLVRAAGHGRLYCAHDGWHVHIVRLSGETIVVMGKELLAFEESLQFETSIVGHGVGLAAGGLATVTLSGQGALALGAHGNPVAFAVTPDNPLSTDPHATLAWSGGLTPALKTDLSWRSVFRHGGQEPVQMLFEGTGFVVVQPYQDAPRITGEFKAIEQIRSLAGL